MLPDGRRLGAHLPLGGGMVKAVERAHEIGATSLQIFGDNPTAWRRRAEPPKEQPAFRDRLRVSDKILSFEPYALALPRGDEEFRLVVDRTLAGLSRSGEVSKLFETAFGPGATPSDLVRALWILNALPE